MAFSKKQSIRINRLFKTCLADILRELNKLQELRIKFKFKDAETKYKHPLPSDNFKR